MTISFEEQLTAELVQRFAVRVVLLYGSCARGTSTPESDVDVVCFVADERRFPTTYCWQGCVIDAWLHPLADARDERAFLKLHDGRLLLDEAGVGASLLARVQAQLAQPPSRLCDEEAERLRVWLWRMLRRAQRNDVSGHYRRHWLLYELLDVWCVLQGVRNLGPDLALRELAQRAPQTHAALCGALSPDANFKALERAVSSVTGQTRAPFG